MWGEEKKKRGEKREGGRLPGLAGDRQGARPAWARGPETDTGAVTR